MFGGRCCVWSRINDLPQPGSESFSLPEPLPEWPQGMGCLDAFALSVNV